jgi:hypothetical protein
LTENVDIHTKLIGAREAAHGAQGVAKGVGHIGDEAEQAGKQSKRGAAGVDRFGRAAKGAETHGRKMTRAFASARVGAGGLRAGVVSTSAALFGGVGLIAGVKLLYTEAREATRASAATDAALKSTGASAWISRRQIEAQATSLSDMAAIDDEVIQKSGNMLLTFRDIRNEAGRGNKIFDRTQRAALDLAAGFTAAGKAMSPTDAALQLGKALNDPAKGMKRLQRIGVAFTKHQENAVAKFMKMGDRVKAQKVILTEINKEFGGQAKSQADPVKRMGEIWHNVAETLGKELLPTFEKGAKWLGALGKDVNQILGDKNYKGADKLRQILTRTFGLKTELQMEKFWDDVKGIAKDLAPLVKLAGGAARTVGRFAGKHPDVARLAAEMFLVAKALRIMRFGKVLSGLRFIAQTKAGQRALSSIVGATGLGGLKGKMAPIGSAAGKALAAAFGFAALEGVAAIASKFADDFMNAIKDQLPEPFKSSIDVARYTNPLTAPHALLTSGPGQFINPSATNPGRNDPKPGQSKPPPRGTHKALVPRGLMVPAGALAGPRIVHEHRHYLDGKQIAVNTVTHIHGDVNRR